MKVVVSNPNIDREVGDGSENHHMTFEITNYCDLKSCTRDHLANENDLRLVIHALSAVLDAPDSAGYIVTIDGQQARPRSAPAGTTIH